MLYVHPDFARRGVASALCDAMEKLAAARKAKKLTVDASDSARSLLRAARLCRRRNATWCSSATKSLGNTTMTKKLPAMTGPTQ